MGQGNTMNQVEVDQPVKGPFDQRIMVLKKPGVKLGESFAKRTIERVTDHSGLPGQCRLVPPRPLRQT